MANDRNTLTGDMNLDSVLLQELNEAAEHERKKMPQQLMIPDYPIQDEGEESPIIDVFDIFDTSDVHDVTYNPEYWTTMSREVMAAREVKPASEGPTEVRLAKLVRLMISQINMDDEDFNVFTITAKDLADFWQVDASNIYKTIGKVADQLLSMRIHVEQKGEDKDKPDWLKLNWISGAAYKKGKLYVKFSPDMKPYLLQLQNKFLRYKIRDIREFKLIYSLRLYELMKKEAFNGRKVKYTLVELKEKLSAQGKYKQSGQFKQKIEEAVKEINATSNAEIQLNIAYGRTKGNPILHFEFQVAWYYSLESKRRYNQFISEQKEGKTDLSFSQWQKACYHEELPLWEPPPKAKKQIGAGKNDEAENPPG